MFEVMDAYSQNVVIKVIGVGGAGGSSITATIAVAGSNGSTGVCGGGNPCYGGTGGAAVDDVHRSHLQSGFTLGRGEVVEPVAVEICRHGDRAEEIEVHRRSGEWARRRLLQRGRSGRKDARRES